MTYKGYELRPDVKTKFRKDGQEIEAEAWAIYANGDFKGSARTIDAAKAHIDGLTAGTLYRPRERYIKIRKTDFDEYRRAMEGKERRGGIAEDG